MKSVCRPNHSSHLIGRWFHPMNIWIMAVCGPNLIGAKYQSKHTPIVILRKQFCINCLSYTLSRFPFWLPSSAIISFLLLNKPKLSAQFLSLFDKIAPSNFFFLNYKLSQELPAVSSDQFEVLKVLKKMVDGCPRQSVRRWAVGAGQQWDAA